jgi:hypothetical protein
VSYVETKTEAENYIEWSRNWNLSMSNGIPFTSSEPFNIGQAKFPAQLGAMSTRQIANTTCYSF